MRNIIKFICLRFPQSIAKKNRQNFNYRQEKLFSCLGCRIVLKKIYKENLLKSFASLHFKDFFLFVPSESTFIRPSLNSIIKYSFKSIIYTCVSYNNLVRLATICRKRLPSFVAYNSIDFTDSTDVYLLE